jgi:hypothetical protein
MKFRSWLTKLFSDDGAVSFSRVATAVIAAFVLGWDTSYVVEAWKLHKLGVVIPLLPEAAVFAAQTGFVSALYVGNKVSGALGGGTPPSGQ